VREGVTDRTPDDPDRFTLRIGTLEGSIRLIHERLNSTSLATAARKSPFTRSAETEEFLVENELCGCKQQFCAENTGFKCGKELLFKVARAPHTFLFGEEQLQPGRGFRLERLANFLILRMVGAVFLEERLSKREIRCRHRRTQCPGTLIVLDGRIIVVLTLSAHAEHPFLYCRFFGILGLNSLGCGSSGFDVGLEEESEDALLARLESLVCFRDSINGSFDFLGVVAEEQELSPMQ